MSKRFETKKETAARLNRFLSALEERKNPEELASIAEYRQKYQQLYKKYSELEKVYEFHRGIIQNISAGILTIDMEGRITFINQAALKTIAYSYSEIRDKNCQLLFADEKEGQTILKQILQEKKMFESYETSLLTRDKQPIPVGFSTTFLPPGQNKDPEGIIFIFRNLAYTHQLRRQIERMDRLATLGELSAGIAHEIRNPLAGIKTSAQVLEESFSPGDFRSQLVSRIVKEIDRSNELLKRFFNFARPSKPKQDFHNIELIIDGVYLLMAPRFKKHKIAFNNNFSPSTPRVYVDESQIEQVILNLFINAVEAIDDNGEVTVETGVTTLSDHAEDDGNNRMVFIRIRDNGRGIAPEKLEKIFNPFYTTKSDGVGLGLSISSRLLEENGGEIEVESEPGKGTTFTIYLPLAS